MNTECVNAIAKAVLYEGYMLYPYRASSVKNRQRFNFGVLYPRAYAEAQVGADRWDMQTECLVEGSADTVVEVKIRFLKVIERSVAKFAGPNEPEQAPGPHFVNELAVNGRVERPWQEATECEVAVPIGSLERITGKTVAWPFAFPASEDVEPVTDERGETAGIVTRKQKAVWGTVEVGAVELRRQLYKVSVKTKNLTHLETCGERAAEMERDCTLMGSMASAHALLGVANGKFVSLLDPPEEFKAEVAGCHNEGVWPVLVGEAGQRDTMLASPIILYDYPQIAPESPGDLFDGTEIDEILALRILTMTDEEKQEVRRSDERARKMLDRTEALPMEQLAKLHGTLRDLRAVEEKAS